MPVQFDPRDEAAAALLNDLHLWRLRAIERVELSRAFWSERDREIHVQPLYEKLSAESKNGTDLLSCILALKNTRNGTVDLVLPITELPKLPLLDLTINVDGTHVHRASRDEGARIQAISLIRLIKDAGIEFPDNLPLARFVDLLTFVFYAPTHIYEKTFQGYKTSHYFTSGTSLLNTQFTYLRNDFGNTHDDKKCLLPDWEEQYTSWQQSARRIRAIAGEYVRSDPFSSTQHPIISLPYLLQELKHRREASGSGWTPKAPEVTALLTYLADLLESLHEEPSDKNDQILRNYFAYGYRWVAFARCRIPLDKSFIISVRERRAIYFTPDWQKRRLSPKEQIQKTAWQMVAFSDAETNHVNIHVSDTAVRLGKPTVHNELGQSLTPRRADRRKWLAEGGPGRIDDERNTFEFYFRQDSQRGRPPRIYIRCPLRLTRVHSWTLYLTMGITLFGIMLLVNRGWSEIHSVLQPTSGQQVPEVDNNLTAKDATLILVPVAFAASFLLTRDTSTLSAWIRRIRQSILLIELFALLAIAFVLILVHHIRIG
ncbi:hypothetical protein [Kitasatospora purpeofusca]|uniref:hypothetical protein n=1 Tax=Kitasatospora purpeofusca TaxID=67352 RepID=UPI0036D3748F